MPRHKIERDAGDGWTHWVSPIHKRYQMSCCDCGLVHTLQFRVIQVMRRPRRGEFIGKLATGTRVQFRVRRDERATAQTRRRVKLGGVSA